MCGTWVQLSLLLLLGLHAADGFLFYTAAHCEFNSTEPNEIEFIFSFFYNKLEFLKFSSSSGRFRGFTDIGVERAAIFNRNSSMMEFWRSRKTEYCLPSVKTWYSHILSRSAKPYAVLSSTRGSDGVLVCSVYGFYPKDISVSWTNNQQPIKTGVTSTVLLPNSDWYYQVHSHLEYSPRSGDHISCLITHASLSSPLVLDWDGPITKADWINSAIGASGLVLGLVLSLSGFIFYKRRSQDLS
uniref:MHC class II beta chain n=1 Tax=Odontobutis potamophilus TaxID=3358257 RepID=A0A1X9GD43_9GOBI|nr:MHC class II beta chain [Odontobutis potamophila]